MERRFYVEKSQIDSNIITLLDDEHQHLSKVLRLKVGDEVECFYDNSNIFNCVIKSISKNSSTLQILSSVECLANPKVNVTLFQGLPKQDKLELITQKATELGATAIVPFSSSFCVAKQNDNKLTRLNKIVVSACKQCGRTLLTKVLPHQTFKQLLLKLKEYDLVIFANEKETDVSLKQVMNNTDCKKLNNVAVVVGSEGGFSKQEIEELCKLCNLKSITLGKRILRTETASVSLLSLVLYELKEI